MSWTIFFNDLPALTPVNSPQTDSCLIQNKPEEAGDFHAKFSMDRAEYNQHNYGEPAVKRHVI